MFGSLRTMRQLSLVVVDVARLGIAVGGGAIANELGNDVADVRVGRQVGFAFRPDADLGAAVAAEHGAILDERHGESEPCGRNGGRGAGDAAADDDEVELAAVGRLVGPAEQFAAQRFELGPPSGGTKSGIAAKQDGVAAAFEAGQIAKRDGGRIFDLDGAAVLPMPLGAFGAERGVERLAVDQRVGNGPERRALSRARPSRACEPKRGTCRRWELDVRRGVPHRFAQAVGEQVGRAHDVHELLVDDPAARFVERLGLDEHEVIGHRAWQAAAMTAATAREYNRRHRYRSQWSSLGSWQSTRSRTISAIDHSSFSGIGSTNLRTFGSARHWIRHGRVACDD